jgi:hypothetical protein
MSYVMLFTRTSFALGIFICISGLLFNPAMASIQKANLGKVKAELTLPKEGTYDSDIRLKIIRHGKKLLNESRFGGNHVDRANLKIIDLDKNKEPEIIVQTYNGTSAGAGQTSIYNYDSIKKKYRQLDIDWCGDTFEIKDIDKDGKLEFQTLDCIGAEFTSRSGARHPILILQYRQGKLVNATRSFPKLVRNDAKDAWQSYLRAKNQGWEVKGALTAYLACKYLLGEEAEGWKQVEQAYQKNDRLAFFKELRQHLIKTGYSRS